VDTLDQILNNLWTSDYVQKNPTKAYKSQYNAEYLAVASYMQGGARPNDAAYSKMGKVLVGLEDNIRADSPPPPPPPSELPFAEATVSNPVVAVIPVGTNNYNCNDANRDFDLDFGMIPRKTINLTGVGRNVRVRNVYAEITDPYGGSGFQRNGMNVNVLCNHVSVRKYFVKDTPTVVDTITVACKPNTKFTLLEALGEAPKDSQEQNAHCDSLQVQGAIGKIEIGLASFYIAGVRPPNHAGKGFQLDILAALGQTGGDFVVDMKKVDFTLQGTPATGARSSFAIGKDDNARIQLFMEEVYCAGGAFENMLVNYPSPLVKTISGSTGNRKTTFPNNAQGWNGEFLEHTDGSHFVTRAMLGV